MIPCSNCERTDLGHDPLVLSQGERVVACICETCQQTVIMARLVIRRMDGDVTCPFAYEQYSAPECAKTA